MSGVLSAMPTRLWRYALYDVLVMQSTGPLTKLFHYLIFQKFFHILLHIDSLCVIIHVIYFSCHFITLYHIYV